LSLSNSFQRSRCLLFQELCRRPCWFFPLHAGTLRHNRHFLPPVAVPAGDCFLRPLFVLILTLNPLHGSDRLLFTIPSVSDPRGGAMFGLRAYGRWIFSFSQPPLFIHGAESAIPQTRRMDTIPLPRDPFLSISIFVMFITVFWSTMSLFIFPRLLLRFRFFRFLLV